MTTVSAASLLNSNTDAVFKFDTTVLLMGDASAPPVTAPFDTTGNLQTLPDGYVSGGLVTTNGISVARALTISEVAVAQSVQPARADVTADKLSIKVQFNEQSKVFVALQEGVTLASLSSWSPTFQNTRNASGYQPKRRLVIVAQDSTHSVIVVRFLPNAILTAVSSDQSYQRGTELQMDVELGCYPDPLVLDVNGNPSDSVFFLGGTGWAQIAGELAPAAAWVATTAYTLGQRVTNTGDTLQCITAGTSGSTAPTNPTSVGGTVTDGTVVWERIA